MPNLSDLLKLAKELKEISNHTPIDLLEKDLVDFFEELKNLVSPDDINLVVEIMGNGTLALEEKLKQIREFISTLTYKENLLSFFQSEQNDHNINEKLMKSWHNPVYLPNLSPEYLIDSWSNLVNRKSKGKLVNFPQNPPNIKQKKIGNFINEEQMFKERMISYYEKIKKKLPIKLENLLAIYSDNKEYYIHFSMILYLLQEGYLFYDRVENILIQGDKFE